MRRPPCSSRAGPLATSSWASSRPSATKGTPCACCLSPDASPSTVSPAFYAWLRTRVGRRRASSTWAPTARWSLCRASRWASPPTAIPTPSSGDLPHLYLYAVNNPAEATIAKRRGYAACISYLTPPLGTAGLYKDLAELKAALAAYRQAGLRRTRRAAAELSRSSSPGPASPDDMAARGIPPGPDGFDRARAAYLYELETELIPLGLHVAGGPSTPMPAGPFWRRPWPTPAPRTGCRPWTSCFLPGNRADEEGAGPAPGERCWSGSWQGDEGALAGPRGPPGDGPDAPPPPAWNKLADFARSFPGPPGHRGRDRPVLRGLAGRYIPPSPGGEPGRRPECCPRAATSTPWIPSGSPRPSPGGRAGKWPRRCWPASWPRRAATPRRWPWCCGAPTTSRPRAKAWPRPCT